MQKKENRGQPMVLSDKCFDIRIGRRTFWCWGYTDCRDSFTGIHTREIACHCIADRKIRASLDCYRFLPGMVRGKCYCSYEIQGE